MLLNKIILNLTLFFEALMIILLHLLLTFSIYSQDLKSPSIIILGTVQDAGSPHIACKKDCCKSLFGSPDSSRKVVSLGLVDPFSNSKFLIEATPDITAQMKILKSFLPNSMIETPNAIFLTHAHIGHYTGLMYLGKEAMSANLVGVYAMPKMMTFLETNGPWNQLVSEKNINLIQMETEQYISLSNYLRIKPILVPHRDEYSETVGYIIEGPKKKALFIPDIDKWQKWNKNIIEIIKSVDYAFIDATFYSGTELNNRDISQIPHPFVIESMELFKDLSKDEKNKIYFIHLNHTNPLLNKESQEYKTVIKNGFNVAEYLQVFSL